MNFQEFLDRACEIAGPDQYVSVSVDINRHPGSPLDVRFKAYTEKTGHTGVLKSAEQALAELAGAVKNQSVESLGDIPTTEPAVKERDCRGCQHSNEIGGVHRLCEHPEAPELKGMAFFATGPPSWCPLENETSEAPEDEEEETPF